MSKCCSHVVVLKERMQLSTLKMGICHGDPFLDNAIVNQGCEFVAWVDFEDVAVAPLIFDIACCVIG